MKNRFIYKLIRYSTAFLMSTCFTWTSCKDDITVKIVDENQYEISSNLKGYISDDSGKRRFTNIEFRDKGSTGFYLNLSHETGKNQTVKMVYDESVLKIHNDRFETEYIAFPKDQVTFENNGLISVKNGEQKSDAIAMSYTSTGNLSADESYVIPVRIEVVEGDIKINDADASKLIFIKDITAIPNCQKTTGIKVFNCIEVNETNPLTSLSFTLADSKKPLIDVVILFSANINYNAETGRVYVFNNENVQAILDNRDKYLKPLQDRGIKVVLGLLGNHDRSGIANLADETAREFAKEAKAVCDAYKLDGIFVDDEYSKYQTPPPMGFVKPSSEAAGRLCYEIKQIQPERLMLTYVYSSTYSLPSIDGVQSGEYVDYALHDYGNSSDLSSNYPGMPKMNMGLHSQEFARGYFARESSLRRMRTDGYGAHMIFAMDPARIQTFEGYQWPALQQMSRVFYDEELIFDGNTYPKDWN